MTRSVSPYFKANFAFLTTFPQDVGKVADHFGELQEKLRLGHDLGELPDSDENSDLEESEGEWYITKDEKEGPKEEEEYVNLEEKAPKQVNHVKENKQ